MRQFIWLSARFLLNLQFQELPAIHSPAPATAMQLTINRIKDLFSASEEVRIVAGGDADGNMPIDILLTDSRSLTVPARSLFFAIATRRGDGHRFIGDLYRKGVRAFVVTAIPEQLRDAPDAVWIVVPDVVKAMQRVAASHPSPQIVAITGSRGKTMLKEWIFQLMEPLTEVIRSPRSYNSQIGVPLSLWEIEPTTRLAVIETGISQAGEMRSLAEIIRPDTVIFTNILSNHDAGFDSRAAKAAEKALLAAAPTVRTVIYNADDALISAAIQPYLGGKRVIAWSAAGNAAANLQITLQGGGGDAGQNDARSMMRWRLDGREGSVTYPCGHDYDPENAAGALAFMLSEEIAPDIIAARFAALTPVGTRLNVSEGVNSCSLIFDSYTSDFSSLGPALDFMRRRTAAGQSRTLILSDLRHESHPGCDIYAEIACLVSRSGIDRFIGVGPQLCAHASLFPPSARFFASTAALLDALDPAEFSDEIILFKGAPEYGFLRIYEALEARKHETVLEVNLDALVRNFNHYRSLLPPSTGLIAMVKASGYGAGSFEIAKTLQDAGAAYMAVAVLDEGIELRRRGITMPIMVMNPRVVNYRSMFANRLEPEIYSPGMLDDVMRAARRAEIRHYPIHIKLDTGMHRTGFAESELPALMDAVEAQDYVEIDSVFSHLATADCPDMDTYTEAQLTLFARCTEYMLSRSRRPFRRHILNTAGIERYGDRYHYDMARLGIGLYGIDPLGDGSALHPVSRLRTVIIAVRDYPAGEAIGYGRRGILSRPARIATIPIGYADGMNRHYGCGALKVLVGGREAPTIGNICMDACMIDVSGIDCRVGDEVVIFGPEAPLQRMADILGTIPYEVLTSVSPRVKRVYYRD